MHRSSEFRAEKIMQDRIFSNPKIKVHFNSVVTKLNIADNKLEGVQVFNKEEEKESTINAAGLFIFIGFEPSTEYVRDLNITTIIIILVDNNRSIPWYMLVSVVKGISNYTSVAKLHNECSK